MAKYKTPAREGIRVGSGLKINGTLANNLKW
jgi:hypothetical protein